MKLPSTIARITQAHGIVDRAGRERQRAERGAGDAALVDDPRQHRERGDGHRRADEQHGVEVLTASVKKPPARKQPHRQDAAERKRRDDAGNRHRRGAPRVLRHQLGSELEPDAEHVEDESELADDEQNSAGGGGK